MLAVRTALLDRAEVLDALVVVGPRPRRVQPCRIAGRRHSSCADPRSKQGVTSGLPARKRNLGGFQQGSNAQCDGACPAITCVNSFEIRYPRTIVVAQHRRRSQDRDLGRRVSLVRIQSPLSEGPGFQRGSTCRAMSSVTPRPLDSAPLPTAGFQVRRLVSHVPSSTTSRAPPIRI
jgi:hypothetical protein